MTDRNIGRIISISFQRIHNKIDFSNIIFFV